MSRLGARARLLPQAIAKASPIPLRRGGVTVADQCVASLSNFAVGVAVARISGASGLGAFALSYAGWIAINNLHRALITDPMAIHKDALRDDAPQLIREGFAAELVLGVGAGLAFALVGVLLLLAGQHTYGIGLVAVAPWLVFLDLQDYWRWVGFMQGKPAKSLANDIVFDCAQGLAILVVVLAHFHSSAAMISAWGVGAVVGSLFGLWQFSVRPSLRGGVAKLRLRWHMSKWLAGYALTIASAGQLVLIVGAGVLGPSGLGGLKAAQGLVLGLSSVVINTTGSLGLPEASRALESRGMAGLGQVTRFVNGATLVVVGTSAIAILVAAPQLLHLLYGAAFVQYAPAARILAVAFMIACLRVGPILTLKATKHTRSLMTAQLVTLAVSLPLVALLGLKWGVTGASTSWVFSWVTSLTLLLYYQRRARQSAATELTDAAI
jgi:O-antigen/teichoic acid export membrane protein